MQFQKPFGSHRKVNLDTGDESMTQQCHADECNINTIMSRYQKTGVIEHENRYQGNYGDFLSATDYHSSLNQINAANEAFSSLPSELRAQFNNDAGLFLDFVDDPANEQAMIDMGLKSNPNPQDLDSLKAQPTEAKEPQNTGAGPAEHFSS